MTSASPPESGASPLRRLHPTTPLQGAIRSLPGFAVLLIPVLTGRGGPGARLLLTVAVLYSVLALPGVVLRYWWFRYRITEAHVEIRSGVLARRHRSIPFDRIQRVEVDRPLLHRLFGTARVRLMTGSGSGAEGVLDAVALAEALALRATVRRLQAQPPAERLSEGAAEAAAEDQQESVAESAAEEPLAPLAFRLTAGLLLRAGAMRFSLVYIALAFSGMQFVGLNVDDVIRWMERVDLAARLPRVAASPLMALALSVGLAVALSWVAGLLVTVVRYFGFTLRADAQRLHTERGLGGRFERAIPRAKVQAALYRSNPITRRFGYARLDVQTMGLNDVGAGQEVLAPLARTADASALGGSLLGLPAAEALRPVSRRFIRRRGLRYSAALGAAAAVAWFVWSPAAWVVAAVPLAWGLAVAQWRAHGFAFDGATLVVQRGALWRTQWHLPVAKFQSVDYGATVFQRRLAVASVYVDTAGAPDTGGPVIEDLPAAEADALAHALFDACRAV